MSIHDDYTDLENRLRQNKPQTEPLPPAFKRQMRQELMEQMTMNESRFSFRKLSMALGGLILLIGIPVFFWLAQMSIGGTTNPGAAPNQGQGLDPARPTPTVATDIVLNGAEGMLVEPTDGSVWVVSSSIPQGQTVGRFDTIDLTVGYGLVDIEEAKIAVKLFDGPRGVLTVERMVSGASGTADFSLPLSELEEVMGESVDLQLNVLLQDVNPEARRLHGLYIDEGWTVDLTAEPPTTTAEIVEISAPRSVEVVGLPEQNYYEVDLTVAYSLADYEEAVLIVGYEFSIVNGGAGGSNLLSIRAGNGEETVVTLTLSEDLLNHSGEVNENVEFFAHINYYDETVAQWVNLYPGDIELSESELNLPYPYLQDIFFVDSVAWGKDELGNPLLNVTVNYNLISQPTAEITVNATVAEGTVEYAAETVPVEAGEGTLTIPLPFNQPLMADEPLVHVSAVLTAGETELQDNRAILIEGATLQPPAEGSDQVWIISTEAVTRTTENGVAADITLIVGYSLSNNYSSGHIAFSNQYQASANGGGSGGGGGSESVVTPGNGVTEFTFGFETTSWAITQDWLNDMSVTLQLFGIMGDGSQVVVAEISQIGIDKEPQN